MPLSVFSRHDGEKFHILDANIFERTKLLVKKTNRTDIGGKVEAGPHAEQDIGRVGCLERAGRRRRRKGWPKHRLVQRAARLPSGICRHPSRTPRFKTNAEYFACAPQDPQALSGSIDTDSVTRDNGDHRDPEFHS